MSFTLAGSVREARLVYDIKQRSHFWHFVIEDGVQPILVENGVIAAIDLGEDLYRAITNGQEVGIVSCRELRSLSRLTNKTLGRLSSKLSRCKRGSRKARRLRCAKRRFLAQQKRRRRDLEHKVSRAAIEWCKEYNVGTLAIGDVRDVANKTKEKRRLGKKSRQKVSNWSHGTMRKYLGYKSETAGIVVHDDVPEQHTSQTCLMDREHRYKPKGRTYRCPTCGFTFHRDGVGCANILSRFVYGELARVRPETVTYRKPFRRGLRSPADTRQVACCSKVVV